MNTNLRVKYKIAEYCPVFAIGLVFFILSHFAFAEEQAPITIKEALESKDQAIQNKTIDKIMDEREKQVNMLIEIVKERNEGKTTQQSSKAAAYLLGKMRAPEAVSVLATALKEPDLENEFNRFRGAVFNALVEIGRPSISPMISNIISSEDELYRNSSIIVISHVVGGKDNLISLLNRVMEKKELTKEEKDRLKKSIEWSQKNLKQYDEPFY